MTGLSQEALRKAYEGNVYNKCIALSESRSPPAIKPTPLHITESTYIPSNISPDIYTST